MFDPIMYAKLGKEICLSDYGIYVESLVNAGGGKVTIADVGTFWTDAKNGKTAVYKTSSSYGWNMTPTTQNDNEINFRLVATYEGMLIDAVVCIVREGTNGAAVYAVANMNPLPS